MTPTQAWHDAIDNQDLWILSGSIHYQFRMFDPERGVGVGELLEQT
ncbi:hypothetical protein AB0B15_11705 [Streptomyces sp. NPDC045456]